MSTIAKKELFCQDAKLFSAHFHFAPDSVQGKMRNCVVSFKLQSIGGPLITLFSQQEENLLLKWMGKEKSF